MARLRTIDEASILDAAERAIVENGAANFTLDAVAAYAGISKGSVLRDYGHKQDLIRAIVQRSFDQYQDMLDTAEQHLSSRIAAHVEVARQPWSDDQRVAARNLCSSLANDQELTRIIADHYEREIETLKSGPSGRGALMAFLALEGLKSIEMFGGYSWPADDRERLVRDISKVSTTQIPDVD